MAEKIHYYSERRGGHDTVCGIRIAAKFPQKVISTEPSKADCLNCKKTEWFFMDAATIKAKERNP